MGRGEPGDGPIGGVIVELGRGEARPSPAAADAIDVRRPGRRRRRPPGRARTRPTAPSAATAANGRPARDQVTEPSGPRVGSIPGRSAAASVEELAQGHRPAAARIAARSARWSS